MVKKDNVFLLLKMIEWIFDIMISRLFLDCTKNIISDLCRYVLYFLFDKTFFLISSLEEKEEFTRNP